MEYSALDGVLASLPTATQEIKKMLKELKEADNMIVKCDTLSEQFSTAIQACYIALEAEASPYIVLFQHLRQHKRLFSEMYREFKMQEHIDDKKFDDLEQDNTLKIIKKKLLLKITTHFYYFSRIHIDRLENIITESQKIIHEHDLRKPLQHLQHLPSIEKSLLYIHAYLQQDNTTALYLSIVSKLQRLQELIEAKELAIVNEEELVKGTPYYTAIPFQNIFESLSSQANSDTYYRVQIVSDESTEAKFWFDCDNHRYAINNKASILYEACMTQDEIEPYHYTIQTIVPGTVQKVSEGWKIIKKAVTKIS